MSRRKTRADLVLDDDTRAYLHKLVRSRSASVAEAERARIMLLYADGTTVTQIARELNTNRRFPDSIHLSVATISTDAMERSV